MFRPDSNRDRTDYSGILMPPDGYKLDRAVGTTYSLDLEALTAVAICLGLSEETDSKLMQNPIGMLNALQKVSDKIVLFCEAGQIKVPTKATSACLLLKNLSILIAYCYSPHLTVYLIIIMNFNCSQYSIYCFIKYQ